MNPTIDRMAPAFVCLLFAVNVGGRSVPSGQLRALAVELGFADPRTVVNSGNIVLRPGGSGASEPAGVGRLLHDAILDRFGVDTQVAVLTGERLAEIVAANPFEDAARTDPAHLLVLVGAGPVAADAAHALPANRIGDERLAVVDGVLYAFYPSGIGTSRLTTAALARAAGAAVTGRNWNTIGKLLALAATDV